MKHALLALLVLAAGIAAAALVVLNPSAGDGSPDGPGAPPPGAGPIATGDWTIYRGDAGMMGAADGNLPNAVRVRWKFKTDYGVYSSPVTQVEVVALKHTQDGYRTSGVVVGRSREYSPW